MERVDEEGWNEWSGLMGGEKGKELVREWVAWWLVYRG
jgi:hypothetical protein